MNLHVDCEYIQIQKIQIYIIGLYILCVYKRKYIVIINY